MDPFDPEPPGGDSHRRDRLLVWAATAGSLACSVLIFLATNTFGADPDPVAEPAPSTATPLAASSTITTTTEPTTTTTTAPPPTTTVTTTTITTQRTTTARITTTTHATSTSPSTTASRPTTTTRRCVVADWQRDTAYDRGSVVAYKGQLWVSNSWNYNATPGANNENAWQFARDC